MDSDTPSAGTAGVGTYAGVLVLGMHRSGTSAATRLVNLLGPSVCVRRDLLMGTSNNEKGFWESRSLIRANDELLNDMGHTWWFPPTLDELARWEGELDGAAMAAARDTFGQVYPTEPWVWKDPRTCLTLSFWRRALGRPVVGIVVYRNPSDIARSLERRNQMDPQFGTALWMRYTRLLLEQAETMPLMVSGYDDIVHDPRSWSESVRRFLGDLGMQVVSEVDAASVREFVDPRLRHNADRPPATGAAADLFDVLRSLDGVHPSFAAPALGDEAPWIEERLTEVGPEWHPSWRNPATDRPTVADRLRARWRRTSFAGGYSRRDVSRRVPPESPPRSIGSGGTVPGPVASPRSAAP